MVPKKYRNNGVGKAMARAFVKIAPALGYKASVFNLVFENNIGSIKIWRDLVVYIIWYIVYIDFFNCPWSILK